MVAGRRPPGSETHARRGHRGAGDGLREPHGHHDGGIDADRAFAGLTSATVGATTSRTFTATDARVALVAGRVAGSRVELSPAPSVAAVAKVTLKVSLRLAAAGLTGRVSLVAAAPWRSA